MKEQEIIEKLRKENEEFKQLSNEHQHFENILSEIDKKRYLTTEEEIERKKVQKQKLWGKDRMATIIRDYKRNLQVN